MVNPSELRMHSVSTVIAVAIVVAILVVGAAAVSVTVFSPRNGTGAKSQTTSLPISASSAVSSSTSSQKVTLILDFAPTGYHSLFYYGVARGIYQKNGIDLTILPGSGSASTVAAVSSGKVDFGFADSTTLMVAAATSNVSNVRMVAMPFQKIQAAIIFNKAAISKVGDLNRKTIGTYQGGGGMKLFPVFAYANNLNYSSIKFIYAAPSTFNQLVALGKADAVLSTVNQVANLNPIAAQNKIQLGYFLYADYGVALYGSALITTAQMIQSHPDVVKRFVNATMYSIVEAAHHPGDAVAAVVKSNPQLNSTLALGDFELTITNSVPGVNSTSNPLTLGWIDSGKMQSQLGIVAKAYTINNPPNPADLYTDQFVQPPK